MLAEGLGVTRDEPIDFRFWAWTAPWISLTAITTKTEPDRSDETSTYRPRFAQEIDRPSWLTGNTPERDLPAVT